MTLGFTLALVYACAAANGCVCVCHEQSEFELDCRQRGGQVRTLATTQQCVLDGGSVVETTDDDAGG